ncbi:hypothetical protein EV178_003536 [Coemansia sp. RSA 1646]|nr:hypothetical protein EV178_003536 [Coemansia sp. RSA 1646]
MFQPARYHQPQAVPISASPSRHIYLEHHALHTSQPELQHKSHIPPPLVLPPLMHRSDRAKNLSYRSSGHPSLVSPRSPPSACYSPGTAVASDATVVDYPSTIIPKSPNISAKSPSLSYVSSKTTSPAPLSALAAAAVSSPSFDGPSICANVCAASMKQDSQQQPQQPAKRRRGGRGARSMYTAEEKEMRRKISHSAIEKRRRERTNNVLRDLQNMVPWLSKSNKVQKLEILEAAAQYIKELRLPSSTVAGGCDKDIRGSPTLSASTHVDESDTDPTNECVEDEQVHHRQHSLPESQDAMKVNFLLS